MPARRHFKKSCCCCLYRGVETIGIDETFIPNGSFEDDGYAPLQQQQMGQHEIPLEIHKLIIVVILLIFAGFSNWIALAYVHDFVGREALPDIVSSFIPEQAWALKIGDMMVTLCSGCMITVFTLHKHRAIVIRRVLFIIAVLYFMRTVTMFSTQLPSGYNNNELKCREQLSKDNRTFSNYVRRVLEQSIHFGLQDIEMKMLCGDLLFSGHTLIMTMSGLTVEYYLPVYLRFCQYVPKLFALIGVTCLILSRTHYTIDVIFAYWLTVGIFSIYHAFVEIDIYRERKNSVLHRLWLVRFVGWLERNVVPGKLDNILEVPLIPHIYSKLRGRSDSKNQQPPTISSTSSTIVIDAP